ncbi:MAG: hypothetical protein KA105_02600 [Caulobacter sp.]|nr:hypothetical protein [Caulobacter sp.]
MNRERRKALTLALELIEQAKAIVEAAEAEERDYAEAMPESLQSGERYERAVQVADDLENVLATLDQASVDLTEAAA